MHLISTLKTYLHDLFAPYDPKFDYLAVVLQIIQEYENVVLSNPDYDKWNLDRIQLIHKSFSFQDGSPPKGYFIVGFRWDYTHCSVLVPCKYWQSFKVKILASSPFYQSSITHQAHTILLSYTRKHIDFVQRAHFLYGLSK